MKFKIKETDLRKLHLNIKNISISDKIENLLKLRISIHDNSDYLIDFSELEIEIILDELTFLFTLKGIEKNGEPNEFGIYIENIIDIFTM